MIINRQARVVFIGTIIMVLCGSSAMWAMNILQPFDTLIRPEFNGPKPFQVSLIAETGFGDSGFDDCGKVNVLKIWNNDQNALAMLEGFDLNSPIGKKFIEIDASDDCVRGHFNVCGDLDLDFAGSLGFRWMFADNFSFDLYLPFYAMQLKRVVWKDQTLDVTDEDHRVKQLLADDFLANVCELASLDLGCWKRTGPGDMSFLVSWFRDFYQYKPLLRNVRLNWRVGFSVPSGFRRDEDKLFAIPFGYDGAFSLPFGFGLDLTFAFHARVGFDVQLTHIFGNTRERRIKTALHQTDLLFLQKCNAHKDFGLIQRFNLYTQLYKIYKGLSLKLGYQFLKQGRTDIVLSGNSFSNAIANTAQVLEDWTLHQIILTTDYDFSMHLEEDAPVKPYLELFARFPFNGKRSAGMSSIGVSFALDF